MDIYKHLLRPVLFKFNPEKAHHFTFKLLAVISRLPLGNYFLKNTYAITDLHLRRNVFGIDFPNPVGLAAGLDKNAHLVTQWSYLGFGFVEIGTVTPKPQYGNPKPRLFRLPKDSALINRMGFNNDGVEKIVQRLKKHQKNIIVGGNIGKNKITSNENAIDDYKICLEALHDYVDYFVVNVSSPNTPGLRELQEKQPLLNLLTELKHFEADIAHAKNKLSKPILLKIAPDLTPTQLDDIVEIVQSTGVDGIIATNTTVAREGLHSDTTWVAALGAGGLSGKPLKQKSTEVVRYLAQKSKGNVPIVAVGGIHTAEDALEKLRAGASLVQLYTGFVYEGPGLVKQICKKLCQ